MRCRLVELKSEPRTAVGSQVTMNNPFEDLKRDQEANLTDDERELRLAIKKMAERARQRSEKAYRAQKDFDSMVTHILNVFGEAVFPGAEFRPPWQRDENDYCDQNDPYSSFDIYPTWMLLPKNTGAVTVRLCITTEGRPWYFAVYVVSSSQKTLDLSEDALIRTLREAYLSWKGTQ